MNQLDRVSSEGPNFTQNFIRGKQFDRMNSEGPEFSRVNQFGRLSSERNLGLQPTFHFFGDSFGRLLEGFGEAVGDGQIPETI